MINWSWIDGHVFSSCEEKLHLNIDNIHNEYKDHRRNLNKTCNWCVSKSFFLLSVSLIRKIDITYNWMMIFMRKRKHEHICKEIKTNDFQWKFNFAKVVFILVLIILLNPL